MISEIIWPHLYSAKHPVGVESHGNSISCTFTAFVKNRTQRITFLY